MQIELLAYLWWLSWNCESLHIYRKFNEITGDSDNGFTINIHFILTEDNIMNSPLVFALIISKRWLGYGYLWI